MTEENDATKGFVLSDGAKQIAAELFAAGLIRTPKERKQRVDWERLMVLEYLAKFYLDKPRWIRIEVGPIPEGETNMLYARTRRWADAIVRMPDHMIIFEAKMKCDPGTIMQVLHYKELFPQTPLFTKYKDEPVIAKIITAISDPTIEEMAKQHGVEWEQFTPSNFEAWYKQVIEKVKS